MNEIINWIGANGLLTFLLSTFFTAVGWLFGKRKRKIENDSGEASALDSIRELNNKIAADLKERYDEQAKRITDMEARERVSIKERGELQGQVSVLTQQHISDKSLIQKLNDQITSYKTEISSWKTKFENLQKQFNQFKKSADEKQIHHNSNSGDIADAVRTTKGEAVQ